MTRRIEKSIVVNVPLERAYEQWTEYEEFPEFMEGVKEVRQTDDRHLHWVAEIGNKTKEWDAEIVAENDNEVVAWRSTSGTPNQGTVRFRPVSPHESEVNLVVEYEPEGAAENLASWFGVVSARVEGDLKRFKEFIESRGASTSASRGGELPRTGTTGATVGATPGGVGTPVPRREETYRTSAVGDPGSARAEGRTGAGLGGARERANRESYGKRDKDYEMDRTKMGRAPREGNGARGRV